MKSFLAGILFMLILIVAGCDESPIIPTESQLVFQGYIYAHQPVTNISVMQSRPLSSSDTVNPPISTAAVTLVKNGRVYALAPTPGKPGQYHYSGSDLEIIPGDAFHMEVAYNGTTASAETVVPTKPTNLRTTLATVTYTKETISTPFGSMSMVNSSDTMYVRWDNLDNSYFFCDIESVDPNRTLMRSDTLRAFRFVTEPTSENYYRVVPFSLNYTGKHRVNLYRVNKEYADLYKSREQDSRSLNEPLTNVKNGLGIFTAFTADSVFFNVKVE